MDYRHIIDLVKSAKQFVDLDSLRKKISVKGEADFVTEVDIEISKYLKYHLNTFEPNIGFFSEEENGSLSDPCWILDPIDGTTNLIFGYNMSSISLGLYSNGKMQFGIVYNPFNDECFTAERNKGAFLNGKAINVSNRDVKNSIIEFGAGSTKKEDAAKNFEMAKVIFENCIDIRRICSSALDLCFIADGRIDGYFEGELKPWDIAAGSLILSEAGGTITDYLGRSLQFASPTSIIASNGKIHDFLKNTINSYI